MKILISSCVRGHNVRWNGSNRLDLHIEEWAESNGLELVHVCPENELFGTPRRPIRLYSIEGKVGARMGSEDVYTPLLQKCQEIIDRHSDIVGFIGIANSPTCGVSAGVKDLGTTIKAPMHAIPGYPTTEISSMRSEKNRALFLERIQRYVRRDNLG